MNPQTIHNPEIRLSTIVDAAEYYTEVRKDLLLCFGRAKTLRVSRARYALLAAIKELKNLSFIDLENEFGMDRGGIYVGVKKANREDVEAIKALATRLDEAKRLHDTERFIEDYGKQGKGSVGVRTVEEQAGS